MERFDPETDAAAGVERLSATGSRHPGWERLPKEPPFDPEPGPLYDEIYGASGTTLVDHDPSDPSRPAVLPLGPVPPAPAKPRRQWLQTIVAAVIGGALALGGAQLLADDEPADAEPVASAPVVATPETTAPGPLTVIPEPTSNAAAIGDAVIPAIVTVQVGDEGPNGVFVRGSGSGVIVDAASGLIVTNDHVVAPGEAYQVVLSDGRTTYDADLVGTDPLTDLAVLRIDAPDLVAVELGATDVLRVGDRAVAVGSPLGLEGGPSLTVGVVSAFDRQVQVSANDTLYGMLQTDAPITQGSSGGALVDSQGRLIGITTAVGVSDVGIEGIGFATPVELVERVINEIISSGEVRHAFIGITGFTRFDEATDGARVAVGVQIQSVENESAASVAGLEEGDIITALDGEPICGTMALPPMVPDEVPSHWVVNVNVPDCDAAAAYVTEHGGTITARSDGVGHGATFVIDLPSSPTG